MLYSSWVILTGLEGLFKSKSYESAIARISPVIGFIIITEEYWQGNISIASLTPSEAIFCKFISIVETTVHPSSGVIVTVCDDELFICLNERPSFPVK